MKKLFFAVALLAIMSVAKAVQTAEKIGRAPVAVNTAKGVLVSWRSLVSDDSAMGFYVYRDGTRLNSTPITTSTNFLDADGTPGATYRIEAVVGSDVKESVETTAWNSMYTTIAISRPAATKDASGTLTGRYRPDDISVGDVDGDGEYELIVKWLPDNQRDSGKKGKASPTYMSCHKMDGTQLWRLCLGHNIRSGNHTMQFLVYDFDGDGKAEMICRTAAGSTDGQGNYVSAASDDAEILATDNTATYQNNNGYVNDGEEFLTVFNGETGAAMHTIWYRPNRGFGDSGKTALDEGWGDTAGNRAERFNAAVAYLDGVNALPSAIMQRGYYTRCYIWAVDWNGSQLATRWLHRGTSSDAWDVIDGQGNVTASGTGKSSYGQGVHGISIGDITGDGCDDICIGSASISSKGALLCSTGYGHGDAIHMADLVPERPGLEVMMPHEESPYGYDVHDALTGEVLVSGTSDKDNGRGLAADFIPSHKGSECWSAKYDSIFACSDGTILYTKKPDTNFRIYWTGDPFDQTFDGRYNSTDNKSYPRIRAWNTTSNKIVTVQEFASYGSPQTCNTTKATPCLQADLLGDWREELILWQYETDYSAPFCTLMIFSTPEETKYKVPCLMQDHMYRMAVAWQNSTYNQPPHLGYSLADSLGVDRASYVTTTTSSAPAVTEEDETGANTEMLTAAAEDKGTVTGTSYTAGAGGELTASTKGEYVKVRTGNNENTITFTVNDGYVITGIYLEGYSNNTSETADRSIYMTGVYVDSSETSAIASSVTFPGGTAGQTPASCEITNITAAQQIKLVFDNSNIVSSDVDSKGKNKQLMLKVIFTYAKSSGIRQSEAVAPLATSSVCYDLCGRRATSTDRGIIVSNGRKYVGLSGNE